MNIELGEVRTINKWKREVGEDSLLNNNVLSLISNHHGSIYKILRHSRINGKEVDAIIYCRTTDAKLSRFIGTLIGVELKEMDLKKVVEQAIERRDFFDYFFIITKKGNDRYLGYEIEMLYRNGLLEKMFDKGIGWILSDANSSVLVFPSKFIRTKLINEWEKWIKKR